MEFVSTISIFLIINYSNQIQIQHHDKAMFIVCMYRCSDILKDPLQPLHDNLSTEIYEIFEQDPVKYLRYQWAIACALCKIISAEDCQRKTVK